MSPQIEIKNKYTAPCMDSIVVEYEDILASSSLEDPAIGGEWGWV